VSSEARKISTAGCKSLIENHPFFCLLNEKDTQELIHLMVEEYKEPNDVIVGEGDLIDKIYFIAEGKAEVTRQMATIDKTSSMHLAYLHKGDVIGLAQTGLFSTSGIRTAKVMAMTPMVLLSIQLSYFYALSSQYPHLKEIGEKFLLMSFIKQTEMFSHLSNDNIRHLSKKIKKIMVPSKTQIYLKNTFAEYCYFLISGEVKVENNEKTLKAGDFFGKSVFIEKGKYDESVYAETDCELFQLDRKIIMTMRKSSKASLWRKIKKIFS
jgi:CRP-like cAMP-binding protein